MNTLARTIIVFVAISFIAAGSVPAQDIADENTRDALVAQREAQVAQMQAQAAQRQAEAARRQAVAVEAAIAQNAPAAPATVPVPPAPPAPVGVSAPYLSFNRGRPSQTGGAGSVLVIPSAEIKIEDVVVITEDMNVMSRIFEKDLEQARIATARGGLFVSSRDPLVALMGGGSGTIESLYLQGYGALFLMKVDFPLSAPPPVEQEQQAEQKTDSDPVWDQMRREMYEPQEAARAKAKEPQEKYDAEKVENLKTTLINALKHAANIRSLKPDESVILSITGSGESGGTRPTVLSSRSVSLSGRNQVIVQEKDNDGRITTRLVQSPSTDAVGSFAPTILVIRAKKSNIDEFAKGNLDVDQFRQRAQVLACPYVGGESGRFDAFNPYFYGGRY